ncbi:GtrA family protein [Geodermatophilus sp. URMC 62]|uniref:GtrA family protein n=1 Tax=Geodermatophilus sp. URMC 62 TaxID=3423414 RepID=UPI00406C6775
MIARLLNRLRRDDGRAQFVRFVAVGAVANLLYGALFVLLADLGSQPANLAGSIASSALANELHRRLTFHAGGRVSWLRAQWEGGGLALAGMVATTAALGWFDALVPGSGAGAQLVVVAVVTGAVGLIRFAVLRWMFGGAAAQTGPSPHDPSAVAVGAPAGRDTTASSQFPHAGAPAALTQPVDGAGSRVRESSVGVAVSLVRPAGSPCAVGRRRSSNAPPRSPSRPPREGNPTRRYLTQQAIPSYSHLRRQVKHARSGT